MRFPGFGKRIFYCQIRASRKIIQNQTPPLRSSPLAKGTVEKCNIFYNTNEVSAKNHLNYQKPEQWGLSQIVSLFLK